MKKTLAMISAALVILSFASCKKSADTQSTTAADASVTTTMPSEKASHLAKKIEDGHFDSFDGYNDEEKEKIKESIEKDGFTLEYNDDGSATVSNEEVTYFVGKGWVDNEYTKDVPPIDFGTITKSSEYDEEEEKFYIFLINDASAVNAQEYVDRLKDAGFKETGENESDVASGIVTFTGENEDGKRVEVACSPYGFTVKIVL